MPGEGDDKVTIRQTEPAVRGRGRGHPRQRHHSCLPPQPVPGGYGGGGSGRPDIENHKGMNGSNNHKVSGVVR